MRSKLLAPNARLGYGLVFFNLGADGVTNALQDRILEKHPATGSQHMMLCMNLWCSAYYALYCFLLSGTGAAALGFVGRHPEAARDLLLYCACGAVGQEFIFLSINTYGSLINTTITTTRKARRGAARSRWRPQCSRFAGQRSDAPCPRPLQFFNILLSVLWHHNPLQPAQWGAVGMVFSGIALSAQLRASAHSKKKKAA